MEENRICDQQMSCAVNSFVPINTRRKNAGHGGSGPPVIVRLLREMSKFIMEWMSEDAVLEFL